MTYPTHKQYSICGAFLAAILAYKIGLSEINYYLALPIIIATAKYGALFPDVDHQWKNVHDKTVPNWIINKIIHATGGSHRSWQTHSIDIVVVACVLAYFIPNILYRSNRITEVNREVMIIILYGFMSGWVSHIIADMLTHAGVRLTCLSTRKVALVPRKLGKLEFKTGEEWEMFNFKEVRFINIFLGLFCLAYPFIDSGMLAQFVQNTQGIIRRCLA